MSALLSVIIFAFSVGAGNVPEAPLSCWVRASISMNRGGPLQVNGGWNKTGHAFRGTVTVEDSAFPASTFVIQDTSKKGLPPSFELFAPAVPGSGLTTITLNVKTCEAVTAVIQ